MGIFKQGLCKKVFVFHGIEDTTYIPDAMVTIYDSGIVHVDHPTEELTMHISNCEIQWNSVEHTDPREKIRSIALTSPNDKEPA